MPPTQTPTADPFSGFQRPSQRSTTQGSRGNGSADNRGPRPGAGQADRPSAPPQGRPAEDDALPLPGAEEDTTERASQAADSERPAQATTPREADRPAEQRAAAAEPSPAPAAPTAAATGGERSLIVVSGGKIVHSDAEVYIADMDALAAVEDPEALFAALKDLRGVRGSDARKRVADKVNETMRERMGL